ncbi:MAG: PAS domain S-box-containing protein [Saprospiraceae bacterium]|jgi:PAS domain S-box-containing protein
MNVKKTKESPLTIARKELAIQKKENEKLMAALGVANKELAFQKEANGKKEVELSITNKELVFQDDEEEKLAPELINAKYARSLIESSLDPLVTISAEGKITDVNEASIKVTGVPRKKLIGTNFSNYFTQPEKAQKGYLQAFEKGFVADYGLTIKHENGSLTDVLYNASVYKDDAGKVLGVFAAARDVTEQKWAKDLRIANRELAFQNDEKEKRAAELGVAIKELAFQSAEKEKRALELINANYARSLIESSLDPLVTISAEGKITDVNEASIKVTGLPREKLIGTNFSNYFTSPEKAQKGYLQAFEKGFVADYGLTIKHENGNLTDVLYNASVYKDEAGKVLGVFAAARDVTEQKWAKDLRIANKELAFQNDEKEKWAAELGIAIKELAFQNEEKEKRAAELGIANKELAFQNEEKEKRAAELGIANKELAFQNEEKEKRAAELIIANKELLAFTYISSHDLQEPLRKIQTFVSIILENEFENLSESSKENFQRMQLAAGRMQQLIDDLLSFSRISTTELTLEKTDLSFIVDEVITILRDTIHEKRATIETSELCTANIIVFQFRQLLYNLISNALKFSNPDIPVVIRVKARIVKVNKLNNANLPVDPENISPEKHYCHITIQDNGIGFEPHFSERIFEVFQKLHGKEVYAGTGIGLAIVKKIVENHNGTITATSELNKGAQFDIYIPA